MTTPASQDAATETFLMTSESVGRGHPGTWDLRSSCQ